MAKKSKSRFAAEVEDDVVYDEAEDEQDKKEWVEDDKAAEEKPHESHDTKEMKDPETTSEVPPKPEEQPAVQANYDISPNSPPSDKKEE